MSRLSASLSALALAVVVASAAGSALAAVPKSPVLACYNPTEFEADQALRLHTELMVIGLKCQEAYKEKDPFGAYRDFTTRQKTALGSWEKRLIAHFGHGGNGTARFDTFRTELANQVSRRAAAIGNSEYCEVMVPLAVQAAALSEPDLRHLLADEKVVRLAHEPICGTGAKARPAAATSTPAPAKPKAHKKKTKGA